MLTATNKIIQYKFIKVLMYSNVPYTELQYTKQNNACSFINQEQFSVIKCRRDGNVMHRIYQIESD